MTPAVDRMTYVVAPDESDAPAALTLPIGARAVVDGRWSGVVAWHVGDRVGVVPDDDRDWTCDVPLELVAIAEGPARMKSGSG